MLCAAWGARLGAPLGEGWCESFSSCRFPGKRVTVSAGSHEDLSSAAGDRGWERKRIGCDYWKQGVSAARGEKMAIETCACAC